MACTCLLAGALKEAALQGHAAAVTVDIGAIDRAAEVTRVGVEVHVAGIIGTVEVGHADGSRALTEIDDVGEAAGDDARAAHVGNDMTGVGGGSRRWYVTDAANRPAGNPRSSRELDV